MKHRLTSWLQVSSLNLPPFFFLYLSFLGGVLGGFVAWQTSLWWLLPLSFLFFLFVWYQKISSKIFLLCLLAFLLGFWRISTEEIAFRKAIGEAAGSKIIGVFEVKETFSKKRGYQLQVQELLSQRRFFLWSKDKFYPGDVLWLEGEIYKPPQIGRFSWDRALFATRGIGFIKVDKLKYLHTIPQPRGFLKTQRDRISERIKKIFSPEPGLFLALIWGEESALSSEQLKTLNLTGTRHIVAVSGANLALLAIFLEKTLARVFARNIRTILIGVTLGIYLLTLDFQVSATRAFLFFMLTLLFYFLSKPQHKVFDLTFLLFLFALFSPFLLFYSISFQLSFLAVTGILFFYPKIKRALFFLPEALKIKDIISLTFAAQLSTLPVSFYYFSLAPAFSVLGNLLLSPFILPLTLVGILLPLLSFLSFPPAEFIGHILALLVSQVFGLLEIISLWQQKLSPALSALVLSISGGIIMLWGLKVEKEERKVPW